jgi:hypothetical protein
MIKNSSILSLLCAIVLIVQAECVCADSTRKQNFTQQHLISQFVSAAPRLSPKVTELALKASDCALRSKVTDQAGNLAIIDYSLPSTAKRFWMFDLQTQELLFEEYVAHGRNTGEDLAANFSNQPGSLASSLGLFHIGDKYTGKHGNSLRLIGLEPGINHLAYERAIVIHGADYVSPQFIRTHRRLGRSFGCPALSKESANKVISSFEEKGGFLFSYYPDNLWLKKSNFINNCSQS